MANFYGTTGVDVLNGPNNEVNYYYFDAGEYMGGDIVTGGTGLSDFLWFNDAVNLTTGSFFLSSGIESIHLEGLGNTLRLSDSIVSSSDHTTSLFRVSGGFGDDELDASAVQSDGVYMNGSRGDDTLIGGDGDDDLDGGADDDLFLGSLGDDTYGDTSGDETVSGSVAELNGDTFNQIETITLTNTGVLTITSFGIGTVTLLNGSNDLTIEAVHSAQMTVNGGTGNDEITIDYDGSLGSASLSGSGGNDTIFGSGGGDFLSGGSGVDALSASDGDDTLDGGTSGDVLTGGDGDDLYRNVESGDLVVELFTDGDDTIETALGSKTLAAGVENLIYTGSSDFTGVGTDSANTIAGGAGDDTLKGATGSDLLKGDAGADSLQGGSGDDTLDGGAHADTLRGLANDDELKAGGGADSLYGGDANDTLKGNAGADRLYGEEGDDHLEGGDGADSLYGGPGNDTASYASAERGIDADLTRATDKVITQAGIDQLSGIENLTGTFDDDRMIGNDNDNVLDGLSGDDTIHGLGGDDLIEVSSINAEVRPGTGDDTVEGLFGGTVRYDELGGGIEAGFTAPFTIEVFGAETGHDTILSSNRIVGTLGNDSLYYFSEAEGGDGNDWFAAGQGANIYDGGLNIDTLFFGFDPTGGNLLVDLDDPSLNTGSALDDDYTGFEVFISEDGADIFRGSSASEQFQTDGNLDIIEGRGGNDTIAGGDFSDILDGGEGLDYADYRASAAVEIDMITNLHFGGEAFADAFISIEGVIGSAFDDTISGTNLDDELIGVGGIDSLSGLGGSDFLEGDGGGDTLTGGAGDDTLIGGEGSDYLAPGAGVDVIEYYAVEHSAPGAGRDTVNVSYEVGTDVIDLSAIDSGSADDAFDFIGQAAFSGAAGELRYQRTGNQTIVMADVDGDAAQDFEIQINLAVALSATDFVL